MAYGRQITTEEREYFYGFKNKMNTNISNRDIQKLRKEIKLNGKFTPYQLLGFIEGDGSFSIQAKKPCISVAQHSNGESAL